ncbi:uncharacterized protein LOC116955479 [Petromyzon marinus]|uniref:uncharacterized protein LOC116955479 n=1 Tax=Petromyzon marinus TaxID=7757 RepID=UPI003F71AEB9
MSSPRPAPAPPAFVYERPGHAADVLRQLDEQRRAAASAGSAAGGLCDASVAAGGGRFPAHCAVLAACSDFFRAALALPPAASSPARSGATTERPPDVRTFNLPAEVTVKGLEQILHFAYTGKLYLSQDSYEDIHRTASVLRIRTLEEACFRFLQQKLGGRADGQEPGKAHACGLAEPFQASRHPCFPPEKVASSSSSSGGSNSSRDSKVCSRGPRQTDDREPSTAQACGLARAAQASLDPCATPGDGGGDGGGVFSRGWRRPADVSPQNSGPFERWNEGCSKRAEAVTTGRWSPPETAHAFDPPRGPLPLFRCPLRDMDTSCRVIVSTIRTGGGGGHLGRDKKAFAAESRSDVEVFEVEPGARLVTSAAASVVAAAAPPSDAAGPAEAESPHWASDKRHRDADAPPGPPLKRDRGFREFGDFGGGFGGAAPRNDNRRAAAPVAADDRRPSLACPKHRRYQVACSNQDGAAYRGVMSGWWASSEETRKGAAGDRAAAAPRDVVPCRPDPPFAPAWTGVVGEVAPATALDHRGETRFPAHRGDSRPGPALASRVVCGRGFVGRLDMRRVEESEREEGGNDVREEEEEEEEEEKKEQEGEGERERGECRGGGIGFGSDVGGGARAESGVRSEGRPSAVIADASSSPVNLSTSCRLPARHATGSAAPASSSLPASLSPRLPAATPIASCPVLGPQMEAAAVFLQRSLGLRVSSTGTSSSLAPAWLPTQPSPQQQQLPPPPPLQPQPPHAPTTATAAALGGGCAVYGGDGTAFSSSGEDSYSDDSDSCASKPDCPEVSLPFPVAGVPEMSRNEFQALLRRHALSAAQLELVHDVRRRSKNRMAARRCRKRKLDCINGLEGDIRKLVSERERALRERELLTVEMAAVRQSCAGLYQTICREVRSCPEHMRLLGPYLPAAVDRPVPDASLPNSTTAATASVRAPLPEVAAPVGAERALRPDLRPVATGEVPRPGERRRGGDGGDGVATVVVQMRAMEWSTPSGGGRGGRARPGDGGKVAQSDVEKDAQDHGKGNGDGFARLQISAS